MTLRVEEAPIFDETDASSSGCADPQQEGPILDKKDASR
jgi:hypothetical protein